MWKRTLEDYRLKVFRVQTDEQTEVTEQWRKIRNEERHGIRLSVTLCVVLVHTAKTPYTAM